MNLLNQTNLVIHNGGAVAGMNDITPGGIDTKGFNGVLIIMHIGIVTTNGVVTAILQSSPDSSTWTDVEGGTLIPKSPLVTTTNTLVAIDVNRPSIRYVRMKVGRTIANSAILNIIGYLYDPGKVPTPTPTDILKARLIITY